MKISKFMIMQALMAISTIGLTACASGVGGPSDARLKKDAKLVDTLDNGVNLYAFRYIGDDQVFVGVMAQEILAMPEYASAVTTSANGYYSVNYSEIGLVTTDIDAMNVAGQAASELLQ